MKTIFCVVFLWILVMLFCSPAFMAHGLTIKVAENMIIFAQTENLVHLRLIGPLVTVRIWMDKQFL